MAAAVTEGNTLMDVLLQTHAIALYAHQANQNVTFSRLLI
jgi:hypothetical protein